MRLTWRPADIATAAGAAESHSYCPPGVRVHVGVPGDDGHRLCPCGSQRDDLRIQRVGHDRGGVRRATAARDHAQPTSVERRGIGRGIARAVDDADGRQRDRTDERLAAHRERDVHGPVAAAGLAVLVRAVEGIDHPHAVGRETSGAVAAFLGQDRIIGAQLGQSFDDEVMGAHVAFVHDPPRGSTRRYQLGAQLDQEDAGRLGDLSRDAMVVDAGDHLRRLGVSRRVSVVIGLLGQEPKSRGARVPRVHDRGARDEVLERAAIPPEQRQPEAEEEERKAQRGHEHPDDRLPRA